MDAEHTRTTERLWTPWRMSYIGGGTREEGCIFCNRLERGRDIESLILLRGARAFLIMNLYPYNTGHIMLVPNKHASDPSQLVPETLAEMGILLPTITNALRRAFGCHGFNVGLNIGATAGAGIEAHLHQHIVPRWQGDANFMPILASTMTIPELIPVTYARIRAELAREVSGGSSARAVFYDDQRGEILLRDGDLPSADLGEEMPVVDSLARALPEGVTGLQLAGWAGADTADEASANEIALLFTITLVGHLPSPWSSVSPDDDRLPEDMRLLVQQAIKQRSPVI